VITNYHNELPWRNEIPTELQTSQVHVWRVLLDVTALQYEPLPGMLSDDEIIRAGKFRFENDRKQFITSRAMLRTILSHYLDSSPQLIRFGYTAYGKPELATTAGDDPVCFNLSHSGVFALYAITRCRKVGIDIERLHHNVAFEQVAERFFSPGERSSLEGIEIDKQKELFFRYWTRKEAFVKATGYGVSFPMENCDVVQFSDRHLSPVILQGHHGENGCWYGRDLSPGPGYAAAIVAEGNDWELLCWDHSL